MYFTHVRRARHSLLLENLDSSQLVTQLEFFHPGNVDEAAFLVKKILFYII